MVVRLAFDAEEARVGESSRVELRETNLQQLVRAVYCNDPRVVTLTPDGGRGRQMRFKWLSGERCEFSFTPHVLRYHLCVAGQRSKKITAQFTLAVRSRRTIVPAPLLDIDWRLPQAKEAVVAAAARAASLSEDDPAVQLRGLLRLAQLRKTPLPEHDPDILRPLRVAQATACIGQLRGTGERLPIEVVGRVFWFLVHGTPPTMVGDLPLGFPQRVGLLGH